MTCILVNLYSSFKITNVELINDNQELVYFSFALSRAGNSPICL